MSIKSIYLITQLIFSMFLIVMSVITPIYFTNGYYYWSAFFIFIFIGVSMGTTDRANSWGDLGKS